MSLLQNIEDAITDVFAPELPPAGAPTVEQPSPAPAAPVGGAIAPGGQQDVTTLLNSLNIGGAANASARTSARI